jgi:hypothetical protein
MIEEYASALAAGGIAGPGAAAVRRRYEGVPGFARQADQLDRIKRGLARLRVLRGGNPRA